MDKLHTCSEYVERFVHFDLSNMTHMATIMHVILGMSIVSPWMCGNREFSEECDIMEQCQIDDSIHGTQIISKICAHTQSSNFLGCAIS